MIGFCRAPDGASLTYNTESTPSYIAYWDANGKRTRIAQGYVRDKDVRKAIREFERQHPEQRKLF